MQKLYVFLHKIHKYYYSKIIFVWCTTFEEGNFSSTVLNCICYAKCGLPQWFSISLFFKMESWNLNSMTHKFVHEDDQMVPFSLFQKFTSSTVI